MFYTALYHTFLHPNTFNDVDGQYIGFDHQIHVAQGFDVYTNFSGWDIYRTEVQLLAMLFPKETSDMVTSLVLDAEQGGGGCPSGPSPMAKPARWWVARPRPSSPALTPLAHGLSTPRPRWPPC